MTKFGTQQGQVGNGERAVVPTWSWYSAIYFSHTVPVQLFIPCLWIFHTVPMWLFIPSCWIFHSIPLWFFLAISFLPGLIFHLFLILFFITCLVQYFGWFRVHLQIRKYLLFQIKMAKKIAEKIGEKKQGCWSLLVTMVRHYFLDSDHTSK